jgi:cellulase/cellobiase CelA1
LTATQGYRTIPGMTRVATVLMAMVLAVTAGAVFAGAAPARAATGGVTCTYKIINQWATGFTVDLAMANAGPPVAGWTARWTFGEPTTVAGVWAASITQQGDRATATNASWNGTIGTGQVVTFGWSATAASTTVPTDLTVNGTAC